MRLEDLVLAGSCVHFRPQLHPYCTLPKMESDVLRIVTCKALCKVLVAMPAAFSTSNPKPVRSQGRRSNKESKTGLEPRSR